MAIVVVVLGAYTRLVDAGLGCPDWPTCYGHLWVPNSEAEISQANDAFQHAPVETDKTWPEQIHRIFASSLGLVILAIYSLVVRERARAGLAWKTGLGILGLLVGGTVARIIVGHAFDFVLLVLALGYFIWLLMLAGKERKTAGHYLLVSSITGFVILQGWFGMWTVTLKLWPQVVTTHLLGGFTILTLLWLNLQSTLNYRWQSNPELRERSQSLLRFTWVFFIIVVLQISLGGWTTSNYAALACPDFPTCHAEWWPHGDFAQGFNIFQHVGPNYLGGQLDNHARTAIHLSHRLGAVLVLLFGIVLSVRLYLCRQNALRRFAYILSGLIGIQISLGIANVLGGLPLAVAVSHNAGGAALLLCVVTLLHRCYAVAPKPDP